MNAVMTKKYALDLDVFLNTGMFHSPEIQARRQARREWDTRKAAQGRKLTEADWKARERKLETEHQEKEASLVASLTGGMAMLGGFVSLAMML